LVLVSFLLHQLHALNNSSVF